MTDLTSLFTDLVRLETRLYNVLDARLKAEHGLPLGQFEFLRVIAARGNARVYDLAHDIAITVGATSKAVDRLESAGRCRRTANPHDRRSSLVELTPAGAEILAAATPTVEAELNIWVGSVLPAARSSNSSPPCSRCFANAPSPIPAPTAPSRRRPHGRLPGPLDGTPRT